MENAIFMLIVFNMACLFIGACFLIEKLFDIAERKKAEKQRLERRRAEKRRKIEELKREEQQQIKIRQMEILKVASDFDRYFGGE